MAYGDRTRDNGQTEGYDMNPVLAPVVTAIDDFFEGRLSTDEFTGRIEALYNFEVDRRALSDREKEVFLRLFHVAAWYSDDDEDRRHGYVGKEEVTAAAREAIVNFRTAAAS